MARPGNNTALPQDHDTTEISADTANKAAMPMSKSRSGQKIDSIRNIMSEKRAMANRHRRSALRRPVSRPHPTEPADTGAIMALADSLRNHATRRLAADSLQQPSALAVTDTADTVRHIAAADSSLTENDTTSLAATALTDSLTSADSTRRSSRIRRQQMDLATSVDFTATDSLVLLRQDTAYMYGESKIIYGETNIAADEIKMDMHESVVYAVGRPDSTGEIIGRPVFSDKSGNYESETMKYNFKTSRGYITNVVTEQGEGFLTGGKTKKMEDNVYYMEDGRYTTCDDHEHPHFYMQLTKAKVIPKKNIVTGPAYMVLCDVPLPLAVPFGYFPFSSKYSSGIIFPSFGDDYQRGFYLREGGYYFAINDYIDLALTGEIYTRGSWGLAAQSTYRKRYKFSGNFNMSYLVTITGDKGSPDYSKQKNFRIAWTHTQDTKANPNMTFSASVNFATSGYSRNDLNSYYNESFTENTKNSTVNMSYRFSSKFQLSTTASINQRTADSTLSVSFPNVTLSLSQVAPFKRKRAVGSEKWYEKIKLSYTGYFQNNLTAKQNEFFKKSLIKDWNNGMRHTMPISATFNAFQYLNITPNIQLNDRMYTRKVLRSWDPAASAEVMDTTYGFYNVFDFNASLTLDTKIYGFFQPLPFLGDKVQMIRHVLSPSISFSGSPDFSKPFWGYYGNYNYTDNNGIPQSRKYSYFGQNIFGSVSEGKTGMVSWSLANNVEMKVKSDEDSTGTKKISLIENFTIGQSYNFAADSLNFSNINTSLSLRLVKNFNLNLSATWDPYMYELNESGSPVRVNKLRISHGKGIAKLSSTGTSFSYTFNNSTFKRKKKDDKNKSDMPQQTDNDGVEGIDDRNGTASRQGNSNNSGYDLDDDGYVKWKIPWSLTVNYSINYSYGDFNYEKMDYNGRITQNLSFNGRIQPTKGWNFNFSASYDFTAKKLAYMNCSISRDLHCFTMSASFVPIGPYKSYNFHIAVKSSLLQDLKYDKRSSTANGVDWY